MQRIRNLGIWMDHADAHLIQLTSEPTVVETIHASFTHAVKEESISKSESGMHNKEQHEMSDYYKQLGNVIKHYDAVLLFGPAQAKDELNNILKKDHHFSKINIYTRPADKMTENQQHAFVKDFFSKMPVATENNIF